jgi:hypothetical protein
MVFDFQGNAPSVTPQLFAFDCDGSVLSETVRWEEAAENTNNYRRLGLSAGTRATTGDYPKAMVHIPVASQSFRLIVRTPEDRTSLREPVLLVRGDPSSSEQGWTHRFDFGIAEISRVTFANGLVTSTVLVSLSPTTRPTRYELRKASTYTNFTPGNDSRFGSFGTGFLPLPLGFGQSTGVSIVVGGVPANNTGEPEGSNTNDAFHVSLDDISIMSLSRGTDCDNSGSPDIFWRNPSTGQTYQWLMNQTTVQGFRPVGTFPGNWRMVGAGNIDNQGASDLVMQDTVTGDVRAWLYNADGSLVARRWLGNPGTAWRASAVADFNYDAMSDIVFRNSDGSNALWTINSSGTLESVQSLPYVGDSAWTIIGAADFNFDGQNDLLWSRHGEVVQWLMEPTPLTPIFIRYMGFAPTDWSLVAAGDFDADGIDNDLVWHNTETGDVGIWRVGDSNAVDAWIGLTNIGTDTPWQGAN